jgi:hypothetical protein
MDARPPPCTRWPPRVPSRRCVPIWPLLHLRELGCGDAISVVAEQRARRTGDGCAYVDHRSNGEQRQCVGEPG